MNKVASRLVGTACGLAFVASAQSAQAQQVPTEQAQGETELATQGDIVVTAQKRSERLSDVPMSITAASGADLAQRGITNAEGLTKLVPGFTYQVSDYGTPVFTIRGIGFLDFALGSVPAVTTYIDEVPLPYSIMSRGATLDLERVEVLKGPQGTLFGQNSTGGAVNYIAAKPTEDLSAGFSLDYGRFNEVNAEAFVSGAIAPGLTARVAARREYREGWQRSLSRPDDRLGARDFENVRILLDWEPLSDLKFALNLSGWNDNSEVPALQFQSFLPKTPANPQNQFVYDALGNYNLIPTNIRDADWDDNTDYRSRNRFRHASLRADWSITGDVTLTSISAFSRMTVNQQGDKDGTNFRNMDLRTTGLLKSYSQEVRLAGDMTPINWMVGVNYQKDIVNEADLVDTNGDNTNVGPFYFTDIDIRSNQTSKTKSVFGSLDYALTDTVTAQVSARYSDQKRRFNGCFADGGDGAGAAAFNLLSTLFGGAGGATAGECINLDAVTFNPAPVNLQLNQNNVSWRGSLNWKPSRDTLLYANISKGYKFGGFSVPAAALASQFTPATQESVLAYEAGFKLAFLDRAVQINAAGFYYDYNDKQIIGTVLNVPFGPITQLVNVPKARVQGAELELVLQPVQGLRIGNSVTLVDSRVKANPNPPGQPRDPLGTLVDFRGERFPNTPRWQTVSDAEYRFDVGSNMTVSAGGTYVYRSASNAGLGENPVFRLDGYGLLDLRLGLESNAGWRIQIWGRNVTNEYYWNNVAKIQSTVTRQPGNPAAYGITLGYKM